MKDKNKSLHHKIYFQRVNSFFGGNIAYKSSKKSARNFDILKNVENEYNEKFSLLKNLKLKLFQMQVKNGKKPHIAPIGRIKFEEALENAEINGIKILIKDLDKKIKVTRKQINSEVDEKKFIEERKIAFLEVVQKLGGLGLDAPLEIGDINFDKFFIEIFPQDWATKNGSLRSWWKGEYKKTKIRFGISLKSSDIQCYISTEKEPAQFISAKQLVDYINELKKKIDGE